MEKFVMSAGHDGFMGERPSHIECFWPDKDQLVDRGEGCDFARVTIAAMDFAFSDHQLLIRDTVRQFMETEIRPHVRDWERTDHFPLDAIQKLGALGCCGMLMPEEWGGAGLDTISYVLMLEEVARIHAAMSTALSVTNSAVQVPLLAYGSEAQKFRHLKSLASGKIIEIGRAHV